jgi:hypothetical protein
MSEFFEKDTKNEKTPTKESKTLIEDNKTHENQELIMIFQSPEDKNMNYFSSILEWNILSYTSLSMDDQTKVTQWLDKWQEFLVNKLSEAGKDLTSKDNQIKFIDTFYVLLQEQEYITSLDTPIQKVDIKKYEEIMDTNMISWLDVFSGTTITQNIREGWKEVVMKDPDRENIWVYNTILSIMQLNPSENQAAYDTKINDHIINLNQEIQKYIDDDTGVIYDADNYIRIITTCVMTHKTIHNWEISDTFKSSIKNTLLLIETLIKKQIKDDKQTKKFEMSDISGEIFYYIQLSQIVWDTKHLSSLGNYWKQYADIIANIDIKSEETEKKDRLSRRNETLYENIYQTCSKYNTNSQILDLNKSYNVKKNDYSVDLTFINGKEETNLTIEPGPQQVIKISNNEWHIFLLLDFLIERIDQENMQSIIEEIKQKKNNTTEEKNNILKNFDLPKNETIQYTRIFQDNDPWNTVWSTMLSSLALQQQLQTWYKINASEPQITWDPETAIQLVIKDNYPVQKNFFFDFYAHGSPTQLLFKKPLTANFLIQLSKDYPDCKFFISTIGCYGWWLVDITKEWKDLKNLFIFTQTKNYLPNTPDSWSTIYYKILLQQLQQGKTYGESVYQADQISNELNYSDAETFLWWEYIAKSETKEEQNNVI